MTISVRLDVDTEVRLERVAKRRRMTKSEAVREGVRLLLESEDVQGDTGPYDAVAHLIGSVDSGGKALSERTGQGLRRILEERRRARRAG